MRALPDPMQWLDQHVPVTLLIDLLDPDGPPSARIFDEECPDLEWLQPQGSLAKPKIADRI